MAININNLHVRLHVSESNSNTTKATNGSSCSNDSFNQEEVVQDTVKEVLRILKELEER